MATQPSTLREPKLGTLQDGKLARSGHDPAGQAPAEASRELGSPQRLPRVSLTGSFKGYHKSSFKGSIGV